LSISRKSGLKYALSYVSEIWRQGIGLSKREIYRINEGRSPVIHSWSTFNRYTGIVKDFVKFCVEEKGVSKLKHLSYETAEEYLNRKIERGCSLRTIKLNASALSKFFDTVGRSDIVEGLRENYQSLYSQAREAGKARPFSNPYRVINNLKEPVHKVIAELQWRTGARIGELKKMEIDKERQRVIIHKSKGGKTREIDFSDRPEKFERICELKRELEQHLKERGWREIRGSGGGVGSYYQDLKQAVKRAGEVYSGSHAFRATYVCERVNELVSYGYTREEALSITEREIGHNRVDETLKYQRG
jgi:integrase